MLGQAPPYRDSVESRRIDFGSALATVPSEDTALVNNHHINSRAPRLVSRAYTIRPMRMTAPWWSISRPNEARFTCSPQPHPLATSCRSCCGLISVVSHRLQSPPLGSKMSEYAAAHRRKWQGAILLRRKNESSENHMEDHTEREFANIRRGEFRTIPAMHELHAELHMSEDTYVSCVFYIKRSRPLLRKVLQCTSSDERKHVFR